MRLRCAEGVEVVGLTHRRMDLQILTNPLLGLVSGGVSADVTDYFLILLIRQEKVGFQCICLKEKL